jgi:YVTN family beta-propeller protein
MDEYSITGGRDFPGMRTSRRAFVLGSGGALACGRQRATGFPGYAFVANSGAQSVAAVDLTSFTVVRQIRLDSAPASVAAHPEREAAYVMAPQSGTIYEIAAASLAVKRKLSLKATAVAMRLAPGGAFLWVLCRSPHVLIRVALDNFGVARLKLPAEPMDFDLSSDGLAAAVVFPEMRTVGLLDLRKPALTRVIPAGDDPRTVRFRLDSQQVLVANRSTRMLTVLDCKSGAAVVRLSLPVEPENFCVKADGGEIFVSGKGMDAVVVVDPFHTQVTETLLAGKAPGAMAISALPEYLFAANPQSGDVTVLEVETRSLLAVVMVGQEPRCITFTPDRQFALVANYRSGDLAVIRMAAIQPGRNKTAPLFNMIPVGTGPVSVAVV